MSKLKGQAGVAAGVLAVVVAVVAVANLANLQLSGQQIYGCYTNYSTGAYTCPPPPIFINPTSTCPLNVVFNSPSGCTCGTQYGETKWNSGYCCGSSTYTAKYCISTCPGSDAAPCPTSPPTLVAHYRLDEIYGSSIAYDSAGGNNPGSVNDWTGNPVTDASWTLSIIGVGLDLSTKPYHIKVPNSARINNLPRYTMAMWFKQTTAGTQVLMNKRDNVLDAQGNYLQLQLYIQSTLKYAISTSNGVTCDSGVIISPNTWYHAVVTYDGTYVQLYVTGPTGIASQVKKTCTPPGATTTGTGDLYIGAENPSTSIFKGIIDDVRLYNSALSAADISGLIPLATPPPPTATTSCPLNSINPFTSATGCTCGLDTLTRWNSGWCCGSSQADARYVGSGGCPTTASPPTAFSLSAPANGATGTSVTPTLTWTDSTGETDYSLQISALKSFAGTILTTTIPADTTTFTVPVGKLSAGTTYFWKVTASNQGGNKIASNAPFSFTIAASAPPPPDPAGTITATITTTTPAVFGDYQIKLGEDSTSIGGNVDIFLLVYDNQGNQLARDDIYTFHRKTTYKLVKYGFIVELVSPLTSNAPNTVSKITQATIKIIPVPKGTRQGSVSSTSTPKYFGKYRILAGERGCCYGGSPQGAYGEVVIQDENNQEVARATINLGESKDFPNLGFTVKVIGTSATLYNELRNLWLLVTPIGEAPPFFSGEPVVVTGPTTLTVSESKRTDLSIPEGDYKIYPSDLVAPTIPRIHFENEHWETAQVFADLRTRGDESYINNPDYSLVNTKNIIVETLAIRLDKKEIDIKIIPVPAGSVYGSTSKISRTDGSSIFSAPISFGDYKIQVATATENSAELEITDSQGRKILSGPMQKDETKEFTEQGFVIKLADISMSTTNVYELRGDYSTNVLAGLLVMPLAGYTPPPPEPPVDMLHYNFDSMADNKVADSKGFGTGTVTGAVLVESQAGFDKALQFSGISQYMKAVSPKSLNNLKSFTASIWFKQTSQGTQQVLANKGSALLYIDTLGKLHSFLGGVDCPTTFKVETTTNTWHHAVVTYDGSLPADNIQIYVDGNPMVACSNTAASSTADALYIGADHRPSQFFNGVIDEVFLYNKALKDWQVAVLYADYKNSVDKLLSGTDIAAICNRNAPKVTVEPAQSGSPGSELRYIVTVQNQDSAECEPNLITLHPFVDAALGVASTDKPVTYGTTYSAYAEQRTTGAVADIDFKNLKDSTLSTLVVPAMSTPTISAETGLSVNVLYIKDPFAAMLAVYRDKGWVTTPLEAETITLNPGETVTRDLQVTAPQDAVEGSHRVAVVAIADNKEFSVGSSIYEVVGGVQPIEGEDLPGIDSGRLLDTGIRLGLLKVRLAELAKTSGEIATKWSALGATYSSEKTKWVNIQNAFINMISRVDQIITFIKSVKDTPTQENLDKVKADVAQLRVDVLGILDSL